MCRKTLLGTLILGMLCLPVWAGSVDDQRMARISYLDGHVSFQHANDVDWSAASVNLALQPGDRLYTGDDGRAEIQFDDGSVVRLAEKTDVEILTLREELVQLKILLGLATLTVQSSVGYEVNTPAAAFTTVRKGVYRFDVNENGDTDAIVRKGLLDAANNNLSRRLESGELIHVTAGAKSTYSVAAYRQRDEWDEWNDRRNADLISYESRRYIPDYVTVGVRELDTYGRWTTVEEYGPAWLPTVDVGWSPYWYGRWCYRPIWGWTWVSYEPWGWLPYHYGRWYHSSRVGWCWLPGASFGFHFWSPGLVRFYNGPDWVSWCPLGPGDYYNGNHFYYRRGYSYYLNDLRLSQRRGPEDLANRHVPGAVRTARVGEFTDGTFGRGNRLYSLDGAQQPALRGSVVTDRLPIQPTARSYNPNPERAAVRPETVGTTKPVVIRTEPSIEIGPQHRFSRITAPGYSGAPMMRGRSGPSERVETSGRDATTATDRLAPRPLSYESNRLETEPRSGASIWNRRGEESGRSHSTPQPSGSRYEGYKRPERVPSGVSERTPSRVLNPSRQESTPSNRYERPAPTAPPRENSRPREIDRPRTDPRRPSNNFGPSAEYSPRIYRPSMESRSEGRVFRSEPPNVGRSFGGGRTFSGPWGGGRPSMGPAPSYRSFAPSMGGPPSARSAGSTFGGRSPSTGGGPSSRSMPSGQGSGGGPSIIRRRN